MERDNTIDIVKGIGIILVVLGHSGFQYMSFIYLFHMALFFAVAGWCFKDAYAKKIKNVCQFVKKRMISLYIPYVLFNIIFILLNNCFIRLNFYMASGPLINNENVTMRQMQHLFGIKDYLKEIGKVLLFSGGSQMSGTFWFFKALFWASLIFAVSRFIVNRIKNRNLVIAFEILIMVIMTALGIVMSYMNILVMNIGTAFSMYAIMLFGYKMKSIQMKGTYTFWVLIVTFGVLLCLNTRGAIALDTNHYPHFVFLWLASISGIIFVYMLSRMLAKNAFISRILSYIGKFSMYIMCFHFLAFKIVNVIWVWIYDAPKSYIASFPVLKGKGGWWLIYTIIGVLLPLILGGIVKKVWNSLKEGMRNEAAIG